MGNFIFNNFQMQRGIRFYVKYNPENRELRFLYNPFLIETPIWIYPYKNTIAISIKEENPSKIYNYIKLKVQQDNYDYKVQLSHEEVKFLSQSSAWKSGIMTAVGIDTTFTIL